MTATFAQPETTTADALKTEIQQIIVAHENSRPRSLQTAVGPSEVGTECVRRLGYKLAGVTPTNTGSDPWAAISGTAVHAWLEQAFGADPDRWLVETRVQVTNTLGGSVDLYDRQRRRIIDHKCSGKTGMDSYRRNGPKLQQLMQINLYALGMENAGHQVDEVALAYYPLGGNLAGMHCWVGPYDRQMALDALTRFDNIRSLVASLDMPTQLGLLPATTSRLCTWCSYHLPRSSDLTKGCPGETA